MFAQLMNRYPRRGISRFFSRASVLVSACFFLAGCVYTAGDRMTPAVKAPTFSSTVPGGKLEDRWWQGFADPLLDGLLDQALAGSFSLQEVAARVRQAEFLAKQAGVLARPMRDAHFAAAASRSPDGGHAERYSGRVSLAWEADLWQRLSAGAKAAALETIVVQEELAEADRPSSLDSPKPISSWLKRAGSSTCWPARSSLPRNAWP